METALVWHCQLSGGGQAKLSLSSRRNGFSTSSFPLATRMFNINFEEIFFVGSWAYTGV